MASSATTGDFHTCAVTAAHALKCWGANAKGQLGDGTKTTRLTPVGVLGFTRGAIVAAAGGQHSCAVSIHPPTEPYESFSGLSNAWCWGYGHSGQLGNGALYNSFTPVRVLRKAHNSSYVAVAITTGEDFSCERLESATVKCWGDNAFGQSGSGEFNGAFGTPRPALTSSDSLRARARLGTRALAIGQHLLRAIYPGDASHEPSTSAVVPLTVQ